MGRTRATKIGRIDGQSIVTYRKAHNMNQHEFWSPLGVTQSGGSRYEAGRNIPPAVLILVELVYIVGLTKEQAQVIKAYRAPAPAPYSLI